MKSILTTIGILCCIFTAEAQQIDWYDSIPKLFAKINNIKPCEKEFYSVLEKSPGLKKELESKLLSINTGNAEISFMIKCDVDCNGNVGNWDIAIDPYEIQTKANLDIILEIFNHIKLIKKIEPGLLKNNPSDYSFNYFKIRVEDGKITTRCTD